MKTSKLILKLLLSIVYIGIMVILMVGCYYLYKEKQKITPWSEAENVEEYSYLDISKMSEKFAFDEENNVGIHFAIEIEKTGVWHTYLVAINENEYEDYKAIIDYTYGRTTKVPDKKRVYGYPVIIDEETKDLAIKNINSFLPKDNQVEINKDNYETYLTNSFLDTTKERKSEFNILLCTCMVLILVVALLLIMTLIDKPIKNK